MNFFFFLSNVEGGIFRNIRDLGALESVLLPLLYSIMTRSIKFRIKNINKVPNNGPVGGLKTGGEDDTRQIIVQRVSNRLAFSMPFARCMFFTFLGSLSCLLLLVLLIIRLRNLKVTHCGSVGVDEIEDPFLF